MQTTKQVFAALEYSDFFNVLAQARVASDAGVDGVVLMADSHKAVSLDRVAQVLKAELPSMRVGVRDEAHSAESALLSAKRWGHDLVWCNKVGITSRGVSVTGQNFLRKLHTSETPPLVFTSMPDEDPDPIRAAQLVQRYGVVPVLPFKKLKTQPKVPLNRVGVSDGLTVVGLEELSPVVSHFIVGKGVSRDRYYFDKKALEAFVSLAKS